MINPSWLQGMPSSLILEKIEIGVIQLIFEDDTSCN